ncbi:hypothetical protein V6N13_015792 [Hibiscus sabdariffa]
MVRLGSLDPNNLNPGSDITNAINQQFWCGTLTSAQAQAAFLSKLRMGRANMLGTSQSSITGDLEPDRCIQVGSPSTMGVPQLNQQSQQSQAQQQVSLQQMNNRTPVCPQLSSGTIHAQSASNPEACPTSPQILGSVSSITNSPMEK